MKHKIPRVAARFPAFWLILTVYLLEFGVPGPGQCHLILRQLSMWVPAVLGMMLMRLSGSYNMAVGAQMTFSAALLGVLLQRFSVPVWAACAVVLVVAVALGILYTVLSSRLQIPLFYLSLCVHLLLDGLNGFFYRMTRQTSKLCLCRRGSHPLAGGAAVVLDRAGGAGAGDCLSKPHHLWPLPFSAAVVSRCPLAGDR